MLAIVSKRHPIRFYLTLLLFSIFGLGMVTICIMDMVIDEWRKDVETPEILPTLIVGILAFNIFAVYRYFRNVPVMAVYNDGLVIRGRRYLFSDLKYLSLTGKQPFPYMLGYRLEGAELIFQDGKRVYIYDELYSNSGAIKTLIENAVKKQSGELAPPATGDSVIGAGLTIEETFKGNPLLSMQAFYTVLFVGGTVSILAQTLESEVWFFIPFPAILLIFFLVFQGRMMHNFHLKGNIITVKSHLHVWKRRSFPLANIKEIVFETDKNRPNGLRIITKNFKAKIFYAGTLRDKTWLRMKAILEGQGIIVRNECIIE